MSEVYKAKDTRFDRIIAIKVLAGHLAENPERKQRFEREANAISQLNHPLISARETQNFTLLGRHPRDAKSRLKYFLRSGPSTWPTAS